MMTMTRFELSIINHAGNGMTAFSGDDRDAFLRAIAEARDTLTNIPYTTTHTIRTYKGGDVWLDEYTIFLDD